MAGTSPLLAPKLHFVSHGFGFEPKVHAKSGGKGRIFEGVPVFRSGSFADSRGIRNTWEDLHIRQMVDNLSSLAKKNIISSVPVRDGHPDFIVGGMRGKGEVVGWHLDVRHEVRKSPVDNIEYTYLVVDHEVSAPYGLEKIDNKLWRNKSSEIGGYVTNDEAEYWPVYLGFAFVDFGAVEGLNFSMSQGNQSYAIYGEDPLREMIVSGDTAPQVPSPMFGFTPAPPAPQAPVAPATPQAPAQHAQAQPTFVFSVGGQNTSDFNKVQGHINNLEAFVREAREGARKQYVSSLVTGNKILAAQQEGMEKFAMTLTDEQFSGWKEQWDAAPTSSILGNHSAAAAKQEPKPSETQEVIDAKARIDMHRLNGMGDAFIKSTDSYRVLVNAGLEKA